MLRYLEHPPVEIGHDNQITLSQNESSSKSHEGVCPLCRAPMAPNLIASIKRGVPKTNTAGIGGGSAEICSGNDNNFSDILRPFTEQPNPFFSILNKLRAGAGAGASITAVGDAVTHGMKRASGTAGVAAGAAAGIGEAVGNEHNKEIEYSFMDDISQTLSNEEVSVGSSKLQKGAPRRGVGTGIVSDRRLKKKSSVGDRENGESGVGQSQLMSAVLSEQTALDVVADAFIKVWYCLLT